MNTKTQIFPTPGPYEVELDPQYLTARISGAPSKSGGRRQHVAMVWSGDSRDMDVVRANAVLLANSDKLLNALRDLLGVYLITARLHPDHWEPEKDVQVIAARNVIADAEGR
jgi:hypothetical protein